VARDGASPVLRFHGRAARAASDLGVTSTLLTLTHTDTTAAAVVVLQR
jgi:phosphopantetheinyl transferase (holo-ACP synthase)